MDAKNLAKVLHRGGFNTELTTYGLKAINDGGAMIDIVYLTVEPTTQQVLDLYEAANYQLVIVDETLIDNALDKLDHEAIPDWLKCLHAFHYGRVYTFDPAYGEAGIDLFHWDQQIMGDSYFGPIPERYLIDLECGVQDSYLRKYPGYRRVAKFGDGTWWQGWEPEAESQSAAEDELYEAVKNAARRGWAGFSTADGMPPFDSEAFGKAVRDAAEKMRANKQGGIPFPGKIHFGPKDGRTFNEAQQKAKDEQKESTKGTWSGSFGGWYIGGWYNGSPFTGVGPTPGGPPPEEQILRPQRMFGLARHYAALGVPDNSDLATTRKAYFELAKSLHPDVNPNRDTTDEMQKVNAAWEAIKKAHK